MKKVLHRMLVILLYAIFVLLSSCTNPSMDNDDYVPETEEDGTGEQETEDSEEYEIMEETNSPPDIGLENEDTIEQGNLQIIESTVIETEEIKESPEEPEQEIYRMEMKPIEVFKNYVVTDGMKVYGISEKDLIKIAFLDSEGDEFQVEQFYKDSDGIYFSVKIMDTENTQSDPVIINFKQSAGIVKEIDSFPEIPESNHVELSESESGNGFKIETTDYKGTICSYVWNGEKPTAFLMIDGYSVIKDGLWWSVPTDYSIRLKGLYYQDCGGNVDRVFDSGRIF